MKRMIDMMSTTEAGESRPQRLPPVNYNKLVVPIRMRSVYWKYFGFPANEEKKIITKDIIVCLMCRHQMIYNRNTSNLRTHLKSRHKSVISKLDEDRGINSPQILGSKVKSKKQVLMPNNSTPDIDLSDITVLDVNSSLNGIRSQRDCQTVVVSDEGNEGDFPNISIVFPTQEDVEYGSNRQNISLLHESSDFNESLINFLITDLISPDIIQGDGFLRLLSSVSLKSVSIPDEKKVATEFIPTVYAAHKQQLHTSIISAGITNLSLSIEEFQCTDGPKCLSVYAHYIKTTEPRIHTKLLSTFSCHGIGDLEAWVIILDKVFGEWNIELSAVSAVVLGTSCSELKSIFSLRGVLMIPCFLFVLQDICSHHIFEFPAIKDLLKHCREAAKWVLEKQIEDDQMDVDSNSDEQQHYESVPVNFEFDQANLWLTTYFMLVGLLRRKKKILENSALIDKCPLKATHWKNITDLVAFLQPFKDIVFPLLEEKNAIISLMYPLILQLTQSNLSSEASDSYLIGKLKEITKNYLNEAYNQESVRQYMMMATSLDPRFKSFISDSKFDANSLQLESLTNLVQADGLIDIEDIQETPIKKSNRLSGINALLGNFQQKKNAVTVEDKIKNEVTFYETASEASLEENPLEWWRNSRHKCPNLIRLAHKYLCVPGSIYFCGQKDVTEYIRFYNKRAALKLNTLDMLLFLHLNSIN